MTTPADQRVPARFGADRAWSERAARRLRLVAGPGAQPTGAELAALRAGLTRRDEPAAELLRRVREAPELTLRDLHRALAAGPAADAPEPVRAFFDAALRRPSWVDDRLLARGAQACRAFGLDAGLVLAYGSLLGGYRTAAALEPLVRTGRLTGGETLRRIQETTIWWRSVTAPGGLAADGDGLRRTLHVRVLHAQVNAQLEADPSWDWELRGVPVNQYDQASTLGVFSTSFLLHLRLLGVRVSRADSRAVMHLWSYVGWLLGVDDQWLPHTERRGRRLLYHFLAYDPPPDGNSRALARALIDDDRRGARQPPATAVRPGAGPVGRHLAAGPRRDARPGPAVPAGLVRPDPGGREPGAQPRARPVARRPAMLLARAERQARAQFARWGIGMD